MNKDLITSAVEYLGEGKLNEAWSDRIDCTNLNAKQLQGIWKGSTGHAIKSLMNPKPTAYKKNNVFVWRYAVELQSGQVENIDVIFDANKGHFFADFAGGYFE